MTMHVTVVFTDVMPGERLSVAPGAVHDAVPGADCEQQGASYLQGVSGDHDRQCRADGLVKCDGRGKTLGDNPTTQQH